MLDAAPVCREIILRGGQLAAAGERRGHGRGEDSCGVAIGSGSRSLVSGGLVETAAAGPKVETRGNGLCGAWMGGFRVCDSGPIDQKIEDDNQQTHDWVSGGVTDQSRGQPSPRSGLGSSRGRS